MAKIKSASSAAKSVFIGGLGAKAIAFIGSVVLARLLVPEDYGYWVIVSMITSFFSLVVDAGFEYYYVVNVNVNQGEETPENEVKEIENSIFFLRFMVNILLFCLQFGFSFLPISLLTSPIDEIIRALSFIHIMNVMGRINEVRLKKYFDFKRITIINIVSEVLSTIVKVSCAVMGMGVMSFAWGSIGKVLFNNLGLVSIGRFKPQIRLVLKKRVKEVFMFATYTWLTQLGQYLSGQIDKFLLKSNYSLSQIGFYNFSNGTAFLFINYVVTPQTSVLMNYISNNQNSPLKLEEALILFLKMAFIFVIPVQVLLFVYADSFILFVYGSQWLDSIALFRIFLVYTLVNILFMPFIPILTAFGQVKTNTILMYIRIIISFLVLWLSVYLFDDIFYYAIAFSLISLLYDPIKILISLKVANVSIFHLFEGLKNVVLSGIIPLIIASSLFFVVSIDNELIHKMLFTLVYVGVLVLMNLKYNCTFIKSMIEKIFK